MPKFEKLNNKGEPTGEFQVFTDRVANRLMRIKNVKWRKVENDQPKISREVPVRLDESIENIPSKRGQLAWVEKQNSIHRLEKAKEETKYEKVKQAIQTKLDKYANN